LTVVYELMTLRAVLAQREKPTIAINVHFMRPGAAGAVP
jgi:hypothetical protein